MTLYLADTSAWNRSHHPAVALALKARLSENALATCGQVRLEILYSARTIGDYEQLALELRVLRQLPCGQAEFERALQVQHRLARQGGLHHRSVKIADLLVAASAEAGGAVLWHYDEDFERIAGITGQSAEWIAKRGTL